VLAEALEGAKRLLAPFDQEKGARWNDDRLVPLWGGKRAQILFVKDWLESSFGTAGATNGQHLRRVVRAFYLEPGLHQGDQDATGSDGRLQDSAGAGLQPLEVKLYVSEGVS